MWWKAVWLVMASVFLSTASGCGSDSDPAGGGGGDWGRPGDLGGQGDAVKIEHRGQDNPDLVVDLIDRNGAFTLDVLSDGTYTAVLDFLVRRPEVGVLRVEGSTVTFRPSGGVENTNSFQMKGDTAVLVGASVFDVDADAQDEPTVLTLELIPR